MLLPFQTQQMQNLRSLEEWKCVAIAKLIARYQPEKIEEFCEAAPQITKIVDSAIERTAEGLKEGERLTPEMLDTQLTDALTAYLWQYPIPNGPTVRSEVPSAD